MKLIFDSEKKFLWSSCLVAVGTAVPIADLTYINKRQLETVVQPAFDRSFQQRDYFWPIPQKELDLNKNLKQNPGW